MDTTNPEMIAGGLLIVRVVIGTLMMGHATQKLFGWLGGYGLSGTGGFFEQLGFHPGKLFAAAASLGELLNQGKNNLQAPWLGFTGFFVLAAMLTLLNFIGEAVRDAFDPRKTMS